MTEPKNPFDFGTGSIDKDQWLKDIDNEQDAFISRYGSATNKHRTALLRDAFADLRRRIANGDMLNRTADGNYQFSSALNREDKHMQEAYQRALGFMGDLARRQIQAPPPEPEKKAIGSLEERYIKSLNPSGKFNTEAYWKNQTDKERRDSLRLFLNNELSQVKSYLDFGNFGDEKTYTDRLNNVIKLLDSENANDWTLQQLGFTKNWLTLPQQLEQEEELPKTRLEQAQENYQAAVADQQAALIEQQLAAMNTPAPQFTSLLSFDPTQYWTYDSYIRGIDKAIEALKYTDENGNQFLKSGVTISRVPGGNGRFTEQRTTRNTAWNGQAAKDARTYAQRQYINGISNDLSNYFKNLGVNYQSYLGNNTSKNNLMTNLSKLFTLDTEGNFVLLDIISKLFAKLEDGKYGLRGSTLSYDPASHTLYNGTNIDTYGEGGIIKGQNGLLVDDSYYVKPTKNAKKPEETPKLENSEEMDAGDWITILGTTAADIGSMLSANAVGAGTAVSAGLGVASTLGNSVNDFRHGNVGSGLANLGIGLTTDLIGLVPGFGAGAKGYKIGRTLTRFARPLMAAFTANNFKEAGNVLGKGLKNGFGGLTAQDWTVLSAALTSMISRGKSVHTRQKNVEFISNATKHSSPTDAKGNITKHIINEEGLTKARKELLQQKIFGFNTSSNNYTEKLWKSIPEGGEISAPFYAKPFEWPSLNIGKKSKQAQLTLYEEALKRLRQPNIPEKNYSSFEARLNGEASPLNVRGPLQPYPTGEVYTTPKTKRKPLTDQQKAARKLRAADKKSKEQAKKQLEELRRNQGYALAEEIPQAGTYAGIQLRQQTIANLNSRYANEVELPTPTPRPAPGPRSEAFNKKYGKAIGKKEIGGILRALRNGGILKALTGLQFPDLNPNGNFNSEYYLNWVNLNWGNPENLQSVLKGYKEGKADFRSKNGLPVKGGDQLKYENANGEQDFMSAYQEQLNYYNKNGGASIFGDVRAYYNALKTKNPNLTIADFITLYNSNVDKLRELAPKKLTGVANLDKTWGDYNTLFNEMYGSYSPFSENLKDTLGESTWRRIPNTFNGINDRENLRHGLLIDGDSKSKVIIDNTGHLVQPDLDKPNNNEVKEEDPQKDGKGKSGNEAVDELTGIKTVPNTKYKNPFDPTPLFIAGKTALGLIGNRNIYKNLLDEMPQAPLRDPINRQLAIVGWQEQIKQGQNQLADLRHATWMQHGYDLLTNLAGMHEAENKGRGIMDDKYMKDSGRQFETAQKLWNLKNEDVMYNLGVGDANRRSIADRARMITQIRAAWRSGDNNILMGGLSDTGNWLLKKYQREQDIIDRARRIQLGTPESRMQERLVTELGDLANKKPSEMNVAELAKVEAAKAKILRESNQTYAADYYNTFSTPWFGGGYKETIVPISKDGSKLEVAKLKARSKDNDRYVSMIKDLRHTSYRRRRRR